MTPRHFLMLLLAYLGFLLLVDVSAYLGVLPAKLRDIPWYDTLGHFGLLGLAGLLLHRALDRRSFRLGALALPIGPVLVLAGSAVEELLQVMSPRRSPSLGDFAADVAGIALFWALDTAWHRRRQPARA